MVRKVINFLSLLQHLHRSLYNYLIVLVIFSVKSSIESNDTDQRSKSKANSQHHLGNDHNIIVLFL